jgi:hypothetical protein
MISPGTKWGRWRPQKHGEAMIGAMHQSLYAKARQRDMATPAPRPWNHFNLPGRASTAVPFDASVTDSILRQTQKTVENSSEHR